MTLITGQISDLGNLQNITPIIKTSTKKDNNRIEPDFTEYEIDNTKITLQIASCNL